MVEATHLIATNHLERRAEYEEQNGVCGFCGAEDGGVHIEEAVSHDYFTDDDIMNDKTAEHVCAACDMCMNEGREFKNGSWLATPNQYLSFSTGEIKDVIRNVTHGEYETPLAVHVAESPMRSEHAYLWTPTNESYNPLSVDFSRQTVRVERDEFFRLVDVVEEMRAAGFRLDDLRHDAARMRDIEGLGRSRYEELRDEIEPYRQTALFELVLKASEKP